MIPKMLVLELVALVFEYVGRNQSCSLSSFLAGKVDKTGCGDSVAEDMLAGKDRSTNKFLLMHAGNVTCSQKMEMKRSKLTSCCGTYC